jgi:hypothetical protein
MAWRIALRLILLTEAARLYAISVRTMAADSLGSGVRASLELTIIKVVESMTE